MDYEFDDLVWAKMGKSPYWPARIIEPDSNITEPIPKEAYQFVVFFGTNDVAWIHNRNIIPHTEDVLRKKPKRYTKGWKFAVEDFKNYLALPLGVPSAIAKETVENKIKHTREPVGKQDQDSPTRKAVRVGKVIETGPKKREWNILSQKSGFKKVSKVQPINVDEESSTNSHSTPDKLDTSGDISFSRRHSLEKGESSKNATFGRKHSIEQDLFLVNFPVSNGDIAELDQSFDDSDQTGTSDRMDMSEQPAISFDAKYGFLGLKGIATNILERFIKCGMEITLWDDKYKEYTTLGEKVKMAQSPAELIHKCDITFCSYESGTDVFEIIINGSNGILKGFEETENLGRKPGYVGLAPVECNTSKRIQEMITTKNGMYLDAPINGNISEFRTRELIINAAGDRTLFSDCEKCFKTISNHYFFLGDDIDILSNTNALLNVVHGTTLAAVSEAMILIERFALFENSIIPGILPTLIESNAISEKVARMNDFISEPLTPIKKVQNDFRSVLKLAHKVLQKLPLSTAANELYEHAKLSEYLNSDVSAVYKAIKHNSISND